jgi:hypothetical protein
MKHRRPGLEYLLRRADGPTPAPDIYASWAKKTDESVSPHALEEARSGEPVVGPSSIYEGWGRVYPRKA